MKTKLIPRIFLGIAAGLLIAGCASTPTAPDKSMESGFLPDYSQLRRVDCPGGLGNCYQWQSPRLTPQNYNAIILDRLQFYPEPKPNENISQETLDKIRNYVDKKLRDELGARIHLVDAPTPGAVRMRWAITAVSAEKQELKAYQYIPVALIVTGAKAAAEGGLPQDAKIAFEIEITDSMTRQPIGLQLRTGTGERIKSIKEGEHKIELSDLMKLFDTWAENAANTFPKYVKVK